MGFLFSTVVVTGLVVGLPALALFGLLRRVRSRWRRVNVISSVLAVSLAAFLALLVPVGKLLWWTMVRQGAGVGASEFHGYGPRLPAGSSSITYYSNYQGTEAVFGISERDFLEWVQAECWSVHEVHDEARVELSDLAVSHVVSNGLKVYERFHPRGTGVSIYFDRAEDLCYYHFSSY